MMVLLALISQAPIFQGQDKHSMFTNHSYSDCVGDFNGDGFQDVMGNDFYTDSFRVLYWEGDSLVPGWAFDEPDPRDYAGAVAYDSNGDGFDDLFITQRSCPSLSSYIYGFYGSDTGLSREPYRLYLGNDKPQGIFLTELNGDGIPDLLVPSTEEYLMVSFAYSALGDGSGGFYAVVVDTLEEMAGLNYLACGCADLNNDGLGDLVAGGFGNSFAVFLNTGDGNMTYAGSYLVCSSPPVIHDFNFDGKVDILASRRDTLTGVDTVGYLPGLGNGVFGDFVPWMRGRVTPRFFRVADFNKDGREDIHLSLADYGGIYLNSGSDFVPHFFYGYASEYSNDRVAIGDFNGDGHLDILLSSSPTYQLYLGNGKGEFGLSGWHMLAKGCFYSATADFNNDGYPDLAVMVDTVPRADYYCSSGVAILYSDRFGRFCDTVFVNINGLLYGTSEGLYAGDLDLDGDSDLWNFTFGWDGSQDRRLLAVLPNNSGVFDTVIYSDLIYIESASAGLLDADCDGLPDVVTAAAIYYNNGGFHFSPGDTLPLTGHYIDCRDINGDGLDDLIMLAGSHIYVLHNNCQGFWGDVPDDYQLPVPFYWITPTGIECGDVTGDGVIDGVVIIGDDQNYLNDSSMLAILKGKRDGTFSLLDTLMLSDFMGVNLRLADFDRDGDLDIALYEKHFGYLRVLRNDGSGDFVSYTNEFYWTPYSPWEDMTVLDLKADRWPDLALPAGGGFYLMMNTRGGMPPDKEEFQFFPNPTRGPLHLLLPANAKSVSIFNIAGRKCLDLPAETSMTLDVSGMARGVYFLLIKTGSGNLRAKFVKE